MLLVQKKKRFIITLEIIDVIKRYAVCHSKLNEKSKYLNKIIF